MSREDYDAMCVLVCETFESFNPDLVIERLHATGRAAADLLGVERARPHELADILRRGRELKEKPHAA